MNRLQTALGLVRLTRALLEKVEVGEADDALLSTARANLDIATSELEWFLREEEGFNVHPQT